MDDTRGVTDLQPGPRDSDRRHVHAEVGAPPEAKVRDEDLEPHEGLRYIARLFKVLAILLILMLVFEVFIGLAQQGGDAIPTLVVEATRLIVFAAFLWGAGDLALMMIESNHDQRATRILMGRLNSKMQKMLDIEADELEILAGNPSLLRDAASRRERSGPSNG